MEAESRELARGPIDLPFFVLVMLLLAIGLVMLLSASSYAALYDKAAGYKVVDGVVQLGDALYYFKHQLAYAVGGVVVMWLVSRVDYQRWRLWSLPVLLVAIVLMVFSVGLIGEGLRRGIATFGRRMRGFVTNEAVVVGVESRTSSPVRVPRDPVTLMHPQTAGLFPAGEGAGYAGGIISAALDGERIAEAVTNYIK